MDICLYSGSEIEEAAWEKLLNHSQGDIHNIYQTYEWASLMEKCYHLTPFFLVVRDDAKPVGGQLFFKKALFRFFAAYESSGGPLYDSDFAEPSTVDNAIRSEMLAKRSRVLYVLTRPNFFVGSEEEYLNRGFVKSRFYTLVLSLTAPSELLWKGLHKHARNGVRKAEKTKITVEEATAWDVWLDFFRLHVTHSATRGIAPKDVAFFKHLYEHFYPKNMVKLFTAFHNDVLVGGMLFLCWDKTMTYYMGASDDNYARHSPNDLLMWRAIQGGSTASFACLDLGDTWPNPKSHLYGIHKFKEKWGGDLVDRSFYISGRAYALGRSLVMCNKSIQNIYERLHHYKLI
jgi:lipid II:glycine glycyltransferase (peptidoglycan interpeptide bridge formation enzyme)